MCQQFVNPGERTVGMGISDFEKAEEVEYLDSEGGECIKGNMAVSDEQLTQINISLRQRQQAG